MVKRIILENRLVPTEPVLFLHIKCRFCQNEYNYEGNALLRTFVKITLFEKSRPANNGRVPPHTLGLKIS